MGEEDKCPYCAGKGYVEVCEIGGTCRKVVCPTCGGSGTTNV